MFTNPIIPGFCPDPSIVFAEGRYYLVTSTFEFFPGVTIWESEDLSNWSYCSAVLTDKEFLNLDISGNCRGLWAATIRYNIGRFYVVTTNVHTHENFICHTDDIHGKWSRPDFIYKTGIDPSLLFLDDGRCFYTSNETTLDNVNHGIIGAFIDPDTGKLLEEMTTLTRGCGGHSTEGPHIYYVDGYYYLIISEGGTGISHHVCALRSKDIHGPYEENPNNPILSHADRKGHEITCTGHADLFRLPNGSWAAVFLAVRRPKIKNDPLGRETFLAPVYWKAGWPVIGNEGFVELQMEIPGVENHFVPDYSVSFAEDYHTYPYLKVRVPKEECYIQDTQKKTLTLIGEKALSENLGHPTLLAFRQRDFNDTFKAKLDLSTLEGKAGISVFLNSNYHYKLEVFKNTFSLIRHVHDFEAVTDKLSIPHSSIVTLEVRADKSFYHFYVDGKLLAKASTAGVSPCFSMNGQFTGALFAIYAEEGKATFIERIELRSKV